MDLITVILFLVLYYIRPQEWSGAFSTIHFVQIVMLTALGTLFFRQRSLRLKDLFRTPHDWMVLGFWLWLVVSAHEPWTAFKENASLYIFYIVIVQTLYSVPRLQVFVGWWTSLVVVIAALALLSRVGYDPLESRPITEGIMKGRLILNLSIFNNPNALGHSIVPAIAMIYYYFIWKRPVTIRLLGTALMFIPLYCIYSTLSKGAFVAAGVTILATLAFGRPKWVQVVMLTCALMFGSGALYSLPRMDELNKSRGDAAIQGRVAAFKHGYNMLKRTNHGVGKGGWAESFINANGYYKASHSSYVLIGGELGYVGLFFLCGILYCNLRTVMTAKTETPDEERIRRMLFVLVISYMISSWMVDFGYRPTFFMFTAAIAALHRHLRGITAEEREPESAPEPALPVWHPQLIPQPALEQAFADAGMNTKVMTLEAAPTEEAGGAAPAPSKIARGWNRITWVDLATTTLATYALVRFWAFIMMRM